MLATLAARQIETPRRAGIGNSDSGTFRRIIGHASPHELEAKSHEISKWIIEPIANCALFPHSSRELPEMHGSTQISHEQTDFEQTDFEEAETLASYLGMFLSTSFEFSST